MARAARIAGSAFGALANAVAGQAPPAGSLDLRTLVGRPVADVITAIVDAFCPPGIIDEDTIRAALAESLAEALADIDQFDPTVLTDHNVVVATRCFVAELVFAEVLAEEGQSAAEVTPLEAVTRENDLRNIVREITDVQATPILQQAGGRMTPAQISTLVQQMVAAVHREMSAW